MHAKGDKTLGTVELRHCSTNCTSLLILLLIFSLLHLHIIEISGEYSCESVLAERLVHLTRLEKQVTLLLALLCQASLLPPVHVEASSNDPTHICSVHIPACVALVEHCHDHL